MKKAFTLIELLAIIIILAIIALIATPIILNVVEDARNSANMSSALLIMNEGHNYYASSMLDESKKEKIEKEQNIYNELTINNKPEFGELYVNSNNEVAMAILIDNKCYKKTYKGEIEVVETSKCSLGQDDEKPTVNQKVVNTEANHNDWYKEDIFLEIEVIDKESGPAGYKRCMGQSECDPDETIYNLDNKVYINTESSSNYVCVIGIDNNGNESEKLCLNYKIDKTLPNIEGIVDKVVNKGEEVDLKEGITYSDPLSGIDGELVIEPDFIDTSIVGTKTVIYKVNDKAGNTREIVRNIIVDAEAPTITYNLVDNSSINQNGWAKNNFFVRANIIDNSGSGIKSAKSCVSNSNNECEPIADISGLTKDFYIEVEGNNRLCIEVTDNNNKTSKICSDTYKLDKTAPVAGTATFTGTLGSNGWYVSDVKVNILNGSDNLSGHLSTTSNISTVTTDTSGTTVTITTTDLAGNSSSRNYVVKVDKTKPTLVNSWVGTVSNTIANVYIQAADNLSGISNIQCKVATQSSNFTNWTNFPVVWDGVANAFRCDVTPATFGHYYQTYIADIYIYDNAMNGGKVTSKQLNIPLNLTINPYSSNGGLVSIQRPSSSTTPTILQVPPNNNSYVVAGLMIYYPFKVNDVIWIEYRVARTDGINGPYLDIAYQTPFQNELIEGGYDITNETKSKSITITANTSELLIFFAKTSTTDPIYSGQVYINYITVNGLKIL